MENGSATWMEEDCPHSGRPLRVCFVAPMIYPVLSPAQDIPMIGGMEVQQKILGEAFVKRGYEVHYVTTDHGQPDPEYINGCVVHAAYREGSGIPGLRFFYPRVSGLLKALRGVDADVYYVRGSGYLIALVSLFAQSRGRKCIFAAAHDMDLDPAIRRLPTLRDEFLYRIGMRRADAVVVQSDYQNRLLKKYFNKTGYVIRNAWASTGSSANGAGGRNSVLWVAMFRAMKRPDYFIELARQFPDQHFVMVGGPAKGKGDIYKQSLKEAEALGNLEMVGFKTLAETEQYYQQARVLVNTSSNEGFPNTFLQAWSQGIPVISFVDPDGLIEKHGLGYVVRDQDSLFEALSEYLNNDSGNNARERIINYFQSAHSVNTAVENYEKVFDDLGLLVTT